MCSGFRVAIYSQDGLGLGHLRRNTLVGQELLASRPEGNVLLIADSPVAPFFRLPPGMDHLKLPTIRKVAAGQWESMGLRLEEAELRKLRAGLLRDALQRYRPNLVLVDHMPGGAKGELLPALETLKKTQPACSIVLGLRDILDAEDVVARIWEADGAYEAVRRIYHRILIYGSDKIFNTGSTYHLPEPAGGIHYCGYVVNKGPAKRADEIRMRQAAEGRPFVFVSVGGGADGHPLMHSYLQALRLLGDRARFKTVMALGANAAPESAKGLEAEARGLPVEIIPYTDDSFSHIAAADLVVSMAGYNTLAEILYLRKRALVVPRSGPSAEQRMRAELFARRGLVDFLEPAGLQPGTLAERLLEDLGRSDYPVRDAGLDMEGAPRAAECLMEYLQ